MFREHYNFYNLLNGGNIFIGRLDLKSKPAQALGRDSVYGNGG